MSPIKKLAAILLMLLPALAASAQLPSVQIKNVNGQTVDTAKLANEGRPFVISFFATWCKPCLRELKAIHELYPDWQDETGMKLVAVSIDEAQSASRVKPLVDAEGWEYEVLLDTNSEFARLCGVPSGQVPHLLIVDGNGSIVESHTGYTDGSEEHIIEKIRELLNK